MSNLRLVESVHGTWFYHWAEQDQHVALCGARIMSTQVPPETWGHVGHLNERYCQTCAKLKEFKT